MAARRKLVEIARLAVGAALFVAELLALEGDVTRRTLETRCVPTLVERSQTAVDGFAWRRAMIAVTIRYYPLLAAAINPTRSRY